ncbi:hypothetical protein GEMRC1_001595 [Eukaryota sp. GEM-RC1]
MPFTIADDEVSYTPWVNWQEWLSVYRLLFASDTSSVSDGLDIVVIWMNRGNCPGAVECTMSLLQALNSHSDSTTSGISLALFSHALSRLSTCLSLLSPLILDSPLQVVDLRHSIVHATIPSLRAMQHAAEMGLKWLKENYWDCQRDVLLQGKSELDDVISLFSQSISRARSVTGEKPAVNESINKVIDDLLNLPIKDLLTNDLFHLLFDPRFELMTCSSRHPCPRRLLVQPLLYFLHQLNNRISYFTEYLILFGVKFVVSLMSQASENYLNYCNNLTMLLSHLVSINILSPKYKFLVIPCSCMKCQEVSEKSHSLKSSADLGKSFLRQSTIDQCLSILIGSKFITNDGVLSLTKKFCALSADSKAKMFASKLVSVFESYPTQKEKDFDYDLYINFSQSKRRNWRKSNSWSPSPFGSLHSTLPLSVASVFSSSSLGHASEEVMMEDVVDLSAQEGDQPVVEPCGFSFDSSALVLQEFSSEL